MTTITHTFRTIYADALDSQKIIEVRLTRKIVDGEPRDYVTIVTESDLANCEDGDDPSDHWGIRFTGPCAYMNTVLYCRGGEPLS